MWQKVQRKRERKCGEEGGRTRQKRGEKENTMKGGGQAVREQEKEEEEVVVDGGGTEGFPSTSVIEPEPRVARLHI